MTQASLLKSDLHALLLQPQNLNVPSMRWVQEPERDKAHVQVTTKVLSLKATLGYTLRSVESHCYLSALRWQIPAPGNPVIGQEAREVRERGSLLWGQLSTLAETGKRLRYPPPCRHRGSCSYRPLTQSEGLGSHGTCTALREGPVDLKSGNAKFCLS